MVSEGVTYDVQTGRFTYRYAIDNRLGDETVIDVAVLVIRDVFLWDLPPLEHTSPAGWSFATTVGGANPPNGTFQEWGNNNHGVPPHGYLSGFSLTTEHPPQATVEVNYFLLRTPSDQLDKGTVPAPALPPFLPPRPIPTLSMPWLIALALIIVAVALRIMSGKIA